MYKIDITPPVGTISKIINQIRENHYHILTVNHLDGVVSIWTETELLAKPLIMWLVRNKLRVECSLVDE